MNSTIKRILLICLSSLSLQSCSFLNFIFDNNDNEGEISENSENITISSLNGKTFYFFDSDTNLAFIPGESFPYTYTIPDDVLTFGEGYFVSFLKIINDELLLYTSIADINENTVTYNLQEEVINYQIISDKYISNSYGEIIFDEDIIVCGGMYITENYALRNNISIETIKDMEDYYKKHTFDYNVVKECKKNTSEITNIASLLSSTNTSVTLPEKISVNYNNNYYDVSLSYELAQNSMLSLNGNTLQYNPIGNTRFYLYVTMTFETYNETISVAGPISLE